MEAFKVLSEVLSLINPLAFGQTTRVQTIVDGILGRLEVESRWQLEIATMLSSLGCVTLPAEVLQKKFSNEPLNAAEEKMYAEHPALAQELLESIPRLEPVAQIVANQHLPTSTRAHDAGFNLASRILKAAIDFDLLEMNSESSCHAILTLKEESGHYGAEVIEAIEDFIHSERDLQFTECAIADLVIGMVLAEDVKDENGILLMPKGQAITSSARRLLNNISKNKKIEQPLKIVAANSSATVMA